MDDHGIELVRTPYEEPYHLCLLLTAFNGRFRAELEYYCNADDLRALGLQMRAYAGEREGEIIYERGSEKSEDRCAFFLSLRVRPIDLRGHCCVSVRLNNNAPSPKREVTEFAIFAEVADINRFGDLLLEFGQLKHRRLSWRVTSGEVL